MDTIPKRSIIAKPYRIVLSYLEKNIWVPIKDPNAYQLVGILLSVSFLFTHTRHIQIFLMTLILLLDWLDGVAARRYKLANRQGWVIDVVVDRISEGLIFFSQITTLEGKIFFAAYILNIILSFYSIKTGKHTILALRFFYILLLLLTFNT